MFFFQSEIDLFLSNKTKICFKFSESHRELKMLQSHHSFKSFVIKHKRNYENLEEYQKRFGIFKENMKKVQFLRETEKGSAEYGPTQFSDLTEQEFKVLRLIQKWLLRGRL